MQLHDELAPLAALACAARDSHTPPLTIGEGKYHQVKGMRPLPATGDALHREAMGDWSASGSGLNYWRELTAEDFSNWLALRELRACHALPLYTARFIFFFKPKS